MSDPFDKLESMLREQLECARTDDTDRILELNEEIRALIARAGEAGLRPDEATRDRLAKLHETIRLALAAEKADVAGRQQELEQRKTRLNKGRRSMSAYQQASGR